MTKPIPHVRESGEGPVVVCLHSSTSSSKQWTRLIERLSANYRVLAPDLYGYGDSPNWGFDRTLTFYDELGLLEPMLDSICGPFHLIGHSYGGAVAMTFAMAHPTRIRSLTLYEPVLFNLLFGDDDHSEAVREIDHMRAEIREKVVRGQLEEAGSLFVGYWSGPKAWGSFEPWQRDSVAKRMPKVVADFDATLGHTVPLDAYRELDIPTLLLYGLQSPASSRTILTSLGSTMPKAETRGLIGMGHMGPLTHGDQVFDVIQHFIEQQPKGILVHQLRRSFRKNLAIRLF